MNVYFKAVALFLSVSLLSACVFQGGGAFYVGEKDSCGFAVSQYSGQGLRWSENKLPISFYVHHSVPKPARDNFVSAIEHWNIAWEDFLEDKGLEPEPLFAIVDKNNLYNGKPGKDGYNFLFFIEDKFSRYESNPNTQAITTIASTGPEIRDTDILINDEVFDYYYDSSYNQEILASKSKIETKRRIAGSRSPGVWFKIKEQFKQWMNFVLKPFKKQKTVRWIATASPKVPRNKVDFPSLIIHELGHSPGLGHPDDRDLFEHGIHRSSSKRDEKNNSYVSVMEPKLASGRARREITLYDLENLFCGYYNY